MEPAEYYPVNEFGIIVGPPTNTACDAVFGIIIDRFWVGRVFNFEGKLLGEQRPEGNATAA